MFLQRKLEEKAFQSGKGAIPVQLVGDFLEGKSSEKWGEIQSTCLPYVQFCNIADILPQFMTDALQEAIPEFEKKLQGFAKKDAILTAVESRSSSPIRIVRNGQRQSISVKGLYPIGEGAGYAGGIVSAAIDGIITAEIIFQKDK